jgi:RimJ/RimL family protein N-acetyltransferase
VRDGETAEVAYAVIDDLQGNGIGTVLVDRLGADARAAGIKRFHAEVHPENTPSLVLAARLKAA